MCIKIFLQAVGLLQILQENFLKMVSFLKTNFSGRGELLKVLQQNFLQKSLSFIDFRNKFKGNFLSSRFVQILQTNFHESGLPFTNLHRIFFKSTLLTIFFDRGSTFKNSTEKFS